MSQMQIEQVLAQIRSYSAHGSAMVRPLAPTAAAASGPGAVAGPDAGAFSQLLRQGIDAVNRSQQSAASLADAYERGAANVDLAQVMLESQKASVSFRALTEVRNRLVNVYQEIMNMPI